jgi:hypothetical protein
MNNFLSSPQQNFQSDRPCNLDYLATEMFNSHSIEELIRNFLFNLGECMQCDRIAICREINHQQVQVLAEAISPQVISIKHKFFPTSYFGIDSLITCSEPANSTKQIFTIEDTTQITATLSIHQRWQDTQVRSVMSTPILFDTGGSSQLKQSWGLVFVQYMQPHRWLPSEHQTFRQITQILDQCLQYWQLRLRSQVSPNYCSQVLSKSLAAIEEHEDLREGLSFTRIYLHENTKPSCLDSHLGNPLNEGSTEITEITEIFVNSNVANLEMTEEDSALDFTEIRANSIEGDVMLMKNINLAMQQWENYHPKVQSSSDIQGVDWDSNTLEDVLESLIGEYADGGNNRAEYLREKVKRLVHNLQLKIDELANIKQQIHDLVNLQAKTQLEFRQILENLREEDY